MLVVANRLLEIALASTTPNDTDVFGRSAFNRYYYATYLTTRAMLAQLNPSWARMGHKQIPQLLVVTVFKKVRDEAKRQEQAGVLPPARHATLRNTARVALSELSNLLTTAYRVRVVADYEPDRKVVRHAAVIRLEDHSIEEARRWQARAAIHSKTVLSIWRTLAIT
jgi:hypothetical protein